MQSVKNSENRFSENCFRMNFASEGSWTQRGAMLETTRTCAPRVLGHDNFGERQLPKTPRVV